MKKVPYIGETRTVEYIYIYIEIEIAYLERKRRNNGKFYYFLNWISFSLRFFNWFLGTGANNLFTRRSCFVYPRRHLIVISTVRCQLHLLYANIHATHLLYFSYEQTLFFFFISTCFINFFLFQKLVFIYFY